MRAVGGGGGNGGGGDRRREFRPCEEIGGAGLGVSARRVSVHHLLIRVCLLVWSERKWCVLIV